MNFCDLNDNDLWLVIRLYFLALTPILLSVYYWKKKQVSTPIPLTLFCSFLL